MIKLQHVEMLLAIEQAGSIRAASKRLGKTQPAVTKALRQAEAAAGRDLGKTRHRLGHRMRRMVLERRWFHGCPPTLDCEIFALVIFLFPGPCPTAGSVP